MQESHEAEYQPVAEARVRKDRADITITPLAHSEDQIGFIAQDRFDESGDVGRIITSVGVHEDEHLRRSRQLSEPRDPGETRRTVPSLGLGDDMGTPEARYLRGPVRRPVVDNDDGFHPRRERVEDGRQRPLLVEGRHEYGDARIGSGLAGSLPSHEDPTG